MSIEIDESLCARYNGNVLWVFHFHLGRPLTQARPVEETRFDSICIGSWQIAIDVIVNDNTRRNSIMLIMIVASNKHQMLFNANVLSARCGKDRCCIEPSYITCRLCTESAVNTCILYDIWQGGSKNSFALTSCVEIFILRKGGGDSSHMVFCGQFTRESKNKIIKTDFYAG